MFPAPAHEHDFTYSAGTGNNANTITAKCKHVCTYMADPITLTLNNPSDLTYDGNAKAATISGYPDDEVEILAEAPDEANIEYYKSEGAGSTTASGDMLQGAPVNAGDYVARITWAGETACVAFSIAKVKLTITAKNQTYKYNGNLQGPGDAVYESNFDEIVMVEGLLEGDALTSIELDGQAKTVGIHANVLIPGSAVIKHDGNTVTDNYDIEYINGKIIITSNKPTTKVSGTLMSKITAKGKNSLVLTWSQIKGAEGYDIFFIKCGKAAPKKVKTIKGNKTFQWTKTGLKEQKAYKAVVKAYVTKNGKKTYVRTSPMVHAYTSGGKTHYTNAKSVTLKKAKVTLMKGTTYKIKAKVNKLQKGKKLMPTGHAPKLRYVSSNKKIATVSKSGKITAKSKGSCKVYVIAVSGASKTVKVTVK